nr:hypothetical protein [Tanacetum cinerariifolium]
MDVLEICMQELRATTTVHHHSIHFKMNNKKRIVNLEYFREMLQICPRIPNQPFDELPFEEEILAFLKELGHNEEIKMITDVNINKLHQPWRSFVVVINKCLSGKSTGYDMYQVEHKDTKKSNEIYYPRFTKVTVNFFMTKDQSILRRNKINWNFARDDHMLTTIKLVSKNQNTHQYDAIFHVELTNEAIKNSESYKEYYTIASGAEPPKLKASARKKQSSFDTTVPLPTAKGKRLKTLTKVDKPAKEKQPAKSSKAKGLTVLSEIALTEAEQMKLATKGSLTQTYISHASGLGADEGTGIIPGVPDVPTYESDDEEISWKSSEDDDDEVKISEHDDDVDDQSDDDEQTDSDNDDDEDNDEDSDGMNVEGDEMDDEGANEEDDADELYRDLNINMEGRDIQMAEVHTTQVIKDTHVTLTSVNLEGQQHSLSMSSRFASNMLNPSPDTGIDSIFESTPRVDVPVMTTAEPLLLSATTLPLPSIPIISHAQQTIALLPTNLEAEVLTRSSNLSKTSHAVAADLSELELKKILNDKMKSNKSIHKSDEQKNLYKALVDAYECDKLILDTYGDTVTLKRRRDDKDKDKEPSAGSNWGSKKRRAGKEPDLTSAPKEKTSKTSGKSTEGSKSHHKTASQSAPADEPMHTT